MKNLKKDPNLFLVQLSADLFHKRDAFEMAQVLGENVLKFLGVEAAHLIWPDLGTKTEEVLKLRQLGKKSKNAKKVYSIRFKDHEDVFFRIEFFNPKQLSIKIKNQILLGENLTKKAITANEIRLQKEETDRFNWMRQLSAGISHELNTPLTTLMFYTSKLTKDTETVVGQQIKKSMMTIEKTLNHYKVMSGDGQFITLSELTIEELGKKIQARAQEVYADKFHTFQFVIPHSHSKVAVQIQDIENIIMILLKNSLQAMEEKRPHIDHTPEIKIILKVDKNKLRLSVSDNGSGIKPEHRAFIFAPGFSTKDVNQGSGMGLCLARAIAFINEGSLRLNFLSQKTQFILELPLIKSMQERKAV